MSSKSGSRSSATGKKAGPADTTMHETYEFQAETRRVLDLMIHSLYSNKEIFLRELISNASDALDRLRFESLKDESLLAGGHAPVIEVASDPDNATLTIRDNGIGMSFDEVKTNLGTIASSGTRRFLEQAAASGSAPLDARLIGQFGVGFYSAFIVAEKVTVRTRRAGAPEDEGVFWESAGDGQFQVGREKREQTGTTIELKLKPQEKGFADPWTLRRLVRQYSDYVNFPIRLKKPDTRKSEKSADAWEQVNRATALWTLPKAELSVEQYQEFYQYLTHDSGSALVWSHNKVEGAQSYTSLLYLPGKAPFDLLFQRDERSGLKLYVSRVFIMDAAEAVLPHYLRFIRGVVDSQDLPLNVSRELLQENELVAKIRAAVVRRSLEMLDKLASGHPADYRTFWQEFGPVLKEGVVEDPANRDRILQLLRFETSDTQAGGEPASLAQYRDRMKPGQAEIYFLTADSAATARGSPHLEIFRRKGVEVLLMSDRVDEWMMSYLREFDGKPFRSVAKGQVDLAAVAAETDVAPSELVALEESLIQRIAGVLSSRVSNVRCSSRLTDSPVCLALGEHSIPIHMQKLLRQAGQEIPDDAPSLELNPAHPLVRALGSLAESADFEALVEVLFAEALLAEGGELPDPSKFVQKVNHLLSTRLGAE